MVSWSGLANFGNSALSGYQNIDSWLEQKQQREMQAAAARAYGEAMSKMSQPQPWRVPMANDYRPPPLPMTLPNFMQSMPKGIDPAAMGMAVDRFAPVARMQDMADYRDQQINLGQQRIDLGAERNQQGQQRLELAQARVDAREKQNAIVNAFREKDLALRQTGVLQRNPVVAREWDRAKTQFVKANDNFTRVQQMLNQADVMSGNMNREVYAARRAELTAMLTAANAELDAASAAMDGFDMSGQGLPQPTPVGRPGGMNPPGPQMRPAAPAQAPRAPQAPAQQTPMAPSPAAAAPPPRPLTPPPQAIEILRARPETATFFEKQYNLPPGGANQYLRAPVPTRQGPAPAPAPGAQLQPGPQGGPFKPAAPWRSPRDAAKFQSAESMRMAANADPINQRSAQLAANAAAAAQPDMTPKMNYPAEAYAGDPAPVDAASFGSPAAPETEDDLIRRAMLSVLDETQALTDVTRAGRDKAKQLRGGAPARNANPYITFTMPQMEQEMKRIAMRTQTARTPEDKAAAKRDFDLLFKASEEAAKRRQRGS